MTNNQKPHESLSDWGRRCFLTKENIRCFQGFLLFSLLSYLYFFTNDLNNYDNISILTHGYGTGVSSGRWLLQILGDWMENLQMSYNIPYMNGLIALCFLFCSAIIVIHVLQIRSPLLCFCLGGVTAAFPVVAATMFFSYTIQYYFFGLLLGMIGIAFCKKSLRWLPVGALFFAMSLGIYQAYLPFLAAVLVLMLIRDTLDNTICWKTVLARSFLYLLALALGYVFYRILSVIFLQLYHTQLNDYQGISSMGQISLSSLPQMVRDTYKHYLRLYRLDYCSVAATPVIRFCIGLTFLFAGGCFLFTWKKRSFMKNLELSVLLFLLPAAANSIVIMVPSGFIYTLMVLGMLSVFYIPMLMADNLDFQPPAKELCTLALGIVILLASFNYAYQSNGNYRTLFYQNKKTENYFSTLMSQVRSVDGYNENMEIAFVGSNISDNSLYDGWQKYGFQYGGKSKDMMDAINAYSRPDFILQYFGYTVRYATSEETEQYREIFSTMETYPNSGSIKILDNIVFVNCG